MSSYFDLLSCAREGREGNLSYIPNENMLDMPIEYICFLVYFRFFGAVGHRSIELP